MLDHTGIDSGMALTVTVARNKSTEQCSALWCIVARYSAVQCGSEQCSAVQSSAVQCGTEQYRAVRYRAVQCVPLRPTL
jgi:hypothetical protein